MERLKTIDYVSGMTHKDVREAINANSEVANGNFAELAAGMQAAAGGASDAAEAAAAAQTAADAAAKAAQGATETAQAADAAAGEAKQTAGEAKTTAGSASEAAAAAQSAAGEAKETAETAKSTAEAAQEAATGAQGTAETAARDAAQAKQDAATAKSDAAEAKSVAEGAQSSAETAGRNAAQAVETATEAQTAANAAQEAAGAAQTAAEGAQRTAETANATAGAAKTAADGAVADASEAKETAAAAQTAASTASQTASTAKQTAETAKSTADTAKQTADTAKSTADGAKASAEGLTGDVTAMGLAQSVLTDYAGTGEPVAAGASAVSVLTSTLKSGELVPWHGWFTLVACYTTEDAGARLGVSGKHGESAEQVIVPLTKVSAGERVVAKLTADPGARTVTLEGGDTVEVRKLTTSGALTLHWAVLYESDPYGNPRRRGGSERERLCACQGVQIQNTFDDDANVRTPVVYNERTGWFEMNGLTDISWKDMLAIANNPSSDVVSAQVKNTSVYYNGARTNVFTRGFSSQQQPINNSSFTDIEVLHLNNSIAIPQSGWMSSDCEVIAIIGYFNLGYAQQFDQKNAFGVQTTLESVKLRSLKQSFTLNVKMLSWDSINYLITTAANTAAITITVHADVYAKMTGGTVDDWGSLGTLAEERGVKLVAYGESGYPFLTRVLWHGYKRLENKINAAKSGDVIYIHPEDRRKITSAQKDDWGALVTAGAEKQISFALPAES